MGTMVEGISRYKAMRPFSTQSVVSEPHIEAIDVCVLREQIRALEEQVQLQQDMLNASVDCIKVIDLKGDLTMMNKSGCVALGVAPDSGFGMDWLNLLPEEIRAGGSVALEEARSGKHARFPGKSQLPGEKPQYWDNILTPLKDADGLTTSILCVSREVTQQREAEQALIRSEKLAAAGRLAASVSHEINNPLEAVTNLLFILNMDTSLAPQSREYLNMAQTELARISQIAIQTLQFYRQSTWATDVKVEEQLDAILEYFRPRLHRSCISVEKRYRHHAPIMAFDGELRQVFTNLIGNAMDAMTSNGQLRVRTRCLSSAMFGRDYVMVTIADNGTGMTPVIQERVFEPFFTTKDVIGTGLGLWVCQSIVDKHGGKIRFRSAAPTTGSDQKARQGTVFTVLLPVA